MTATEEYFEQIAPSWIQRYQNTPSFRSRLQIVHNEVADLVGQSRCARVLDYGGGPGVISSAVSAYSSIVVCLDTSFQMTLVGRQNGKQIDRILDGMLVPHRTERVRRIAGPIQAVSGARLQRFDLILAIAVLEYDKRLDRTIGELASMLMPGGHLLFSVPNPRSLVRMVEVPVDAFAARVGRRLKITRLSDRIYSSIRPSAGHVAWSAAIEAVGLTCERILPLPLGHSGLRARLSPNLLVVASSVSHSGPRVNPEGRRGCGGNAV